MRPQTQEKEVRNIRNRLDEHGIMVLQEDGRQAESQASDREHQERVEILHQSMQKILRQHRADPTPQESEATAPHGAQAAALAQRLDQKAFLTQQSQGSSVGGGVQGPSYAGVRGKKLIAVPVVVPTSRQDKASNDPSSCRMHTPSNIGVLTPTMQAPTPLMRSVIDHTYVQDMNSTIRRKKVTDKLLSPLSPIPLHHEELAE